MTMPEALTIDVRHQPGHVLVAVAGEVDISTAPQLREQLAGLAGKGRPLIIDLDRVNFIDASGLGVLAGTAKRAAAHGTSLHVVAARPHTRRLFSITGLDQHIPLTRTLAEALTAAAGNQPGAGRLGRRTRELPIRLVSPPRHLASPPAGQVHDPHDHPGNGGDGS